MNGVLFWAGGYSILGGGLLYQQSYREEGSVRSVGSSPENRNSGGRAVGDNSWSPSLSSWSGVSWFGEPGAPSETCSL